MPAPGRAQAVNLIVNGDFEAGNTGFSSDATFVPSGLVFFGEYSIRTDPSTANSQWCGQDHTSGSGQMLVCDGFSGLETVAWRQTVAVHPGARYIFRAWVRNLVCSTDFADPVMELRAAGAVVAGPLEVTENLAPEHWLPITGTFNASAASARGAVSSVTASNAATPPAGR